MKTLSHLLRGGVVLMALAAAACGSLANGPEDAFDPNTRFPIAVEPHMKTMLVPYGGPGAGMTPNAQAQLSRFATDYLDHGNGAIAVSAPRGYPGAPDEFAAFLADQGVPRHKILIGSADAPNGPPQVKITYISYEAEATPCGDWSENLASTYDNAPPPNFGCAIQNNIAAMVADPRDLISPTPETPADTQRRLTVLQKYRNGEITAATRTQAQSGAVSEVGQ